MNGHTGKEKKMSNGKLNGEDKDLGVTSIIKELKKP
jgi:hypothetical protein